MGATAVALSASELIFTTAGSRRSLAGCGPVTTNVTGTLTVLLPLTIFTAPANVPAVSPVRSTLTRRVAAPEPDVEPSFSHLPPAGVVTTAVAVQANDPPPLSEIISDCA